MSFSNQVTLFWPCERQQDVHQTIINIFTYANEGNVSECDVGQSTAAMHLVMYPNKIMLFFLIAPSCTALVVSCSGF